MRKVLNSIMNRIPEIIKNMRRKKDDGADNAKVTDAQKTGIWGEELAAEYLETKGFKIIGRRIRIRRYELDIVALREVDARKMIVFVEVKTRKSDMFGGGRAALDKRKRHALCRAAAHYMRKLPPTPFRFDLVEIIGQRDSPISPVIRHYMNAFPMELRYTHTGLHKR